MKCLSILCTGKFDRHSFIGREKRGVERASFPAILKCVVFFGKKKILQLLVGKFETFIMQLTSSGLQRVAKFKKINRRKLELGKGTCRYTKSRFWKIKNCACENNICITSITVSQKLSNRTRAQRMKTISSHLNCFYGSFIWSINGLLIPK